MDTRKIVALCIFMLLSIRCIPIYSQLITLKNESGVKFSYSLTKTGNTSTCTRDDNEKHEELKISQYLLEGIVENNNDYKIRFVMTPPFILNYYGRSLSKDCIGPIRIPVNDKYGIISLLGTKTIFRSGEKYQFNTLCWFFDTDKEKYLHHWSISQFIRVEEKEGKPKEVKTSVSWDILDNKKNVEVKKSIGNNSNQNTTETILGSLLILLDVSGSMKGEKLNSAKLAAKSAVQKTLKNKTEVSIFAFSGSCNDFISAKIGFTTNSQKLLNFIDNLTASGGTPMAPALLEANNYLHNYKSSTSKTQMILLLADGDNACGDIKTIMRQLKGKDLVFRHETVGLEVQPFSEASNQLRSIANSSGGQYHYAKSHTQLADVMDEAVEAMKMLEMLGNFKEK